MPTPVVRAPLPIRCLRLDAAILTPTGKQVLACMATFANADGTRCFPSAATVARETGLHRVTVATAIAHLRRIGALVQMTSTARARAARQAIEYRIAVDHLPATSAMPRRSPGLQGDVAQDYKPLYSRTTSPDQKTGSEGGEEAPPPPIAQEVSKPEPEDRMPRLCARLGYSTRPDAIAELREWLQGAGFGHWWLVEDFLSWAAQRAPREARARGLYLRDVRGCFEAWAAMDQARAAAEPVGA